MKYKDTYSLKYQDFYIDDYPQLFRYKGDSVHVIAEGVRSNEINTAFFRKVVEFLDEHPASTVKTINDYIGAAWVDENAIVKYDDGHGFYMYRVFYIEEDYEE